MLASGVVVLGLGLLLLAISRRVTIGDGVFGFFTRFSELTRMVIGLVVMGVGYHLGVWALPRRLAAVQVPREYWVWVVLASVGMVAMSLALDRMESSRVDEKE